MTQMAWMGTDLGISKAFINH